jgi:Icc-related predicted phosphoesterase
MKIYVASDIHLEFGDLTLSNTDDVDVLILSGDICVAKDIVRNNEFRDRTRAFFKRVSVDFPHVVYVMGNHEHYSGDFAKSQSYLQNWFTEEGLDNIHLLEKSTFSLGDYLFVGGTLWTDMNKHDPLTLFNARSMLNDFTKIKNSNAPGTWRFMPAHAAEDHSKFKHYLWNVIQNHRERNDSKKIIVVGHHAPSKKSIHPYYTDQLMNGCYSSDLDEFIFDHPEIVLWTHGHTHESFNYTIGDCRIVCNPRGYWGHETRAIHWQPQLVELP